MLFFQTWTDVYKHNLEFPSIQSDKLVIANIQQRDEIFLSIIGTTAP